MTYDSFYLCRGWHVDRYAIVGRRRGRGRVLVGARVAGCRVFGEER